MSKLMRTASVGMDELVTVISELSIDGLRELINALNAARGGWLHIYPHNVTDIDDFFEFSTVSECLEKFNEYNFNINDEYFFWDDERPWSVPDEVGVREWIEESTNDYAELAEDVMNLFHVNGFLDALPEAVMDAAKALKEAEEAEENE